MNKELLLKVKAAILAEPKGFDMNFWHKSCGTTHCIAGWVDVLVRNERIDCSQVDELAKDDLEISEFQASRLFYLSAWPDKFAESYAGCQSHKEAAQVAADRIDHFIATEGAE